MRDEPLPDRRAIQVTLTHESSVVSKLCRALSEITRSRRSRMATLIFKHGDAGLTETYLVELLDPTKSDTEVQN